MDFATLTPALTTQITGAVTSAMGPAALVLGVTIGYKIYKHFAKG